MSGVINKERLNKKRYIEYFNLLTFSLFIIFVLSKNMKISGI